MILNKRHALTCFTRIPLRKPIIVLNSTTHLDRYLSRDFLKIRSTISRQCSISENQYSISFTKHNILFTMYTPMISFRSLDFETGRFTLGKLTCVRHKHSNLVYSRCVVVTIFLQNSQMALVHTVKIRYNSSMQSHVSRYS